MDLDQRNERIFIQHEQGDTYKKIAALFGISPGRVRQICSREKRRFERRQSVPTLKTLVSKRLQNALQFTLYNQNLLENPEQIVALGSQKILRIKNIGRKSLKELADALLRLAPECDPCPSGGDPGRPAVPERSDRAARRGDRPGGRNDPNARRQAGELPQRQQAGGL